MARTRGSSRTVGDAAAASLRFPPEGRPLVFGAAPPPPPAHHAREGFFRFRRHDGKVLLTSDVGEWRLLARADFDAFVGGTLAEGHPARRSLADAGMLLPYLDVERTVERYRRRNARAGAAPHLHIVIPTLRCNAACAYCHAGRAPMKARGADMDLGTARDVVDFIFRTPSERIAIELQGGEPLANFPAVRFIVEYAREVNRRERRDLQLLLVTNLGLMDEEKMRFLLAGGVLLCTSLDGPADLHDAARRTPGGGGHARALEWMGRVHDEYRRAGRDLDLWHVDALATMTKPSLGRWREIVDAYVALGIKTIHLRPLNPMGFAARQWERWGYGGEEFVASYTAALDYIIGLNLRGTELIERGAALFLARILGDDDPGYVDLQSPCGAGMGQLAYGHDGSVYTCDEGRMVARMGDDLFKIGEAASMTFDDVLRSDTVRAVRIASLLEAAPGCRSCVYLPYCGICPVLSYVTQHDIFGQMPTNMRCRTNRGILDHLFTILDRGDEATLRVLRRWTVRKSRGA